MERDAEIIVLKVMATVKTNPFTKINSTLMNISTGQHAGPEVECHLTNVKELGFRAFNDSISADQKKTIIVRLNATRQPSQCLMKTDP